MHIFRENITVGYGSLMLAKQNPSIHSRNHQYESTGVGFCWWFFPVGRVVDILVCLCVSGWLVVSCIQFVFHELNYMDIYCCCMRYSVL
jgi:hypothetical protein